MGPALKLPHLLGKVFPKVLGKVLANTSKVKRVGTKSGLLFCGYYTFTSQVGFATSELKTLSLFHIQVADIFLISGPSMVPTLSEGDLVLAVPIRSVFLDF